MRVLWVGDAVVSSGFAKCTHEVCNRLHSAGHEVVVLGINYFGDPHSYPYPILPCRQPLDCGYDAFGVSRLPIMIERAKPDVVVLLNDPWNVNGYMLEIVRLMGDNHPPVVGWLAVDGKNQKGDQLNSLAHVITWTQFGAGELVRGGYHDAYDIVPLGVDTSLFHPTDKSLARSVACQNLNIPEDAFLIGCVGRNQPRKRLDLTIEYFAEWLKYSQADDAYLYLHVAPTGDMGFDIKSLTRYYGVSGKVILCEPEIGYGVENDIMPAVYNSFDVMITTTQGEGWGLCTLEAMACGVPCIVPDYSALGEWTRDAVVKIPCTSSAVSAPIGGNPYTIGGVVDKTQFILALDQLYRSAYDREIYSQLGVELTATLTWNNTASLFMKTLEDMLAGLKAPILAELGV